VCFRLETSNHSMHMRGTERDSFVLHDSNVVTLQQQQAAVRVSLMKSCEADP